MKSVYYSFYYFNILLFFSFLTNNIVLLLILLIIKGVFYVNLESDIEYEFNFLNLDYERFDAKFLEIDIDDQFLYTLANQEIYLSFNCRFFFDFYGGSETLDCLDFIDFTIYNNKDLRNLKNVYSQIEFNKEYTEEYIYKMQDRISRLYIDSFFFKLVEKDINQYNILYKTHYKEYIKKKQFFYLKKKYE